MKQGTERWSPEQMAGPKTVKLFTFYWNHTTEIRYGVEDVLFYVVTVTNDHRSKTFTATLIFRWK